MGWDGKFRMAVEGRGAGAGEGRRWGEGRSGGLMGVFGDRWVCVGGGRHAEDELLFCS